MAQPEPEFYDNVLLKLRRKYSKEETVAMMDKQLSESLFKLGELKNENAELKHELYSIRNKVVVESGKTKKEWLKDDLVALLNEQLNK